MITYIPVSSITIPADRQRKEFDPHAHEDLKQSILDRGLLNPISIREPFQLVAGERRLRAIMDIWLLGQTFRFAGEAIPDGCIPAVSLGSISDLEAEECELDENIRRKDLTWQEHANATARLLALRQAVAQEKGLAIPQHYDLAESFVADGIASSVGQVREEVKLARNMHNPIVSGAKNRSEAIKALKREERASTNALLAARIGPILSHQSHSLHQGDCIEWMKGQDGGQFDIILTDPPYGIGADEFGSPDGKMGAGTHGYSDDPKTVAHLLCTVPGEFYRLAKPNAHLYLFCDLDWFHGWKDVLADEGWKVFRTPIIWYKPNAYRTPWPEKGPRRQYECILYAVKGTMLCQRLGGDVIEINPDENIGHSAQKPVGLYTELLSRSAQPGMSVFDPFCGSGPIFPAAHELQCRATGCEMDAASYGIAATRIHGLR